MTFREAMAYIVKQTHRRCLLIRIPYWIMMLAALPLGLLPNPPVTRDQLRQLKDDNIVSKRALGLADLGVEATSIDLIVPEYLSRYRPGGQFLGLQTRGIQRINNRQYHAAKGNPIHHKRHEADTLDNRHHDTNSKQGDQHR